MGTFLTKYTATRMASSKEFARKAAELKAKEKEKPAPDPKVEKLFLARGVAIDKEFEPYAAGATTMKEALDAKAASEAALTYLERISTRSERLKAWQAENISLQEEAKLTSTDGVTKSVLVRELPTLRNVASLSDAQLYNATYLGGKRPPSIDSTILQRQIGIFLKGTETSGGRAKLAIFKTVDSATGITTRPEVTSTLNFLLATVSEPTSEKYQIFQTFGSDYIYFFNRNPLIYSYAGTLINSHTDFLEGARADIKAELQKQWRNDFNLLYTQKLRGTKCAENRYIAALIYEDVVREGYLLNFAVTQQAVNPAAISFNFTMYVVKQYLANEAATTVARDR